MTGCIESGLSLAQRELDETIERMLPQVEDLVQSLSPDEIVTSEAEEFGYRASVPFRFSDGIGRAEIVARLFRYRDRVRLDLNIAHNRVFALPGGGASDRRCFMNDYMASVSLAAGSEQLPQEFRRSVLRGVRAARNAVAEYNKKQIHPWNQVAVVGG